MLRCGAFVHVMYAVHVCICMYVMHVCMQCMFSCVHVCMHVCMYVCMYVCYDVCNASMYVCACGVFMNLCDMCARVYAVCVRNVHSFVRCVDSAVPVLGQTCIGRICTASTYYRAIYGPRTRGVNVMCDGVV